MADLLPRVYATAGNPRTSAARRPQRLAPSRFVHRFLCGRSIGTAIRTLPDVILLRPGALTLLMSLLAALAALTGPSTAAAEPRLPGPVGWPLAGPPAVVRGFDEPQHEYGPGHRGVDFATRPGLPVRAAVAGTVAGRGVVSIDHGGYRTTYEPVVPRVRAGQRVGQGETIGRVGSGGHCADRCLHWGLRRGATYLDPLQLITARPGGPLRLLAADRRAVASERARVRAEAAAAAQGGSDGMATAFGAVGPGGRHGFSRPVAGAITSAFGMRFHPVLRRWKLHDGT